MSRIVLLFILPSLISPELYDVAIVSEDGTELQCHKCILVARLGMYEVSLTN